VKSQHAAMGAQPSPDGYFAAGNRGTRRTPKKEESKTAEDSVSLPSRTSEQKEGVGTSTESIVVRLGTKGDGMVANVTQYNGLWKREDAVYPSLFVFNALK